MKKKAIYIVAGKETYKNLSTFEDIKQLNETVRTYKEQYQEQLTKTAVAVLDHLHRYAAKYTGVCFMSKNNIARSIGKCKRTVIRACLCLENLGVIKQYEMKRNTDWLQTNNAIVIQPIRVPLVELEEEWDQEGQENENVPQEESENPIESGIQNMGMSPQENKCSFKTTTKKIKHNVSEYRFPYIKFVPKNLQHLQAIYGQHLKELYGRVWLAAKKLNVDPVQEFMQEIGSIALSCLKPHAKRLNADQQCQYVYKVACKELLKRWLQGGIIRNIDLPFYDWIDG